MALCNHCKHGSYRGYRRDGLPSTVYFWCVEKLSHHDLWKKCDKFVEGEPRRYDKHGELMEVE